MQINYNNSDYIGLLQTMGRFFHAPAEENVLRLPPKLGKGFFSAYNLPDGLSVMMSDSVFSETMFFHQQAAVNQQYFILQFNEPLNESTSPETYNEPHVYHLRKNTILLTSSLMESTFVVPEKVRIRAVRIIFGIDFLNRFIGNEIADKFISNYFSILLKRRAAEFIGADYRLVMDEMIKEKIEHPIRIKFIYNRALILIEKLVTSFISKLEKNAQVIKLKDDEISRLIKVESLLVKDFSGTPPTIAALSKVATMSPTKLKKDFKSMYGLPIYEYFQKNRMVHAKALLMEAKYAVKEVGMMVGYSNLGHFAASFKKEFGVLPSGMVNDHSPGFKEKDPAIVFNGNGKTPVVHEEKM
jgi:AraC-like DNA-binding protein